MCVPQCNFPTNSTTYLTVYLPSSISVFIHLSLFITVLYLAIFPKCLENGRRWPWSHPSPCQLPGLCFRHTELLSHDQLLSSSFHLIITSLVDKDAHKMVKYLTRVKLSFLSRHCWRRIHKSQHWLILVVGWHWPANVFYSILVGGEVVMKEEKKGGVIYRLRVSVSQHKVKSRTC